MKTLITFTVGKHLWESFVKADKLNNKLDAAYIEGRFALEGKELSVLVPADQYEAAKEVM